MRNKILNADVLDGLKQLPDGCVQTCITSPPYWGLRDYGTALWVDGNPDCDHVADPSATKKFGNDEFNINRPSRSETKTAGYYKDICPKCGAIRIDKQLGLEKTPEEFIEKMVEIFREVRRVLRDDGTCWLNLGDSYAGSWGNSGSREGGQRATNVEKMDRKAWDNYTERPASSYPHPILKPKDLCGIPWRVAFALQADGWYLRSDIIWSKPNPMPESCTDRPTKSHEYLFLLSKQAKYYYDIGAIREQGTWKSPEKPEGKLTTKKSHQPPGGKSYGSFDYKYTNPNGRNRRSVWTIATEPYPEAHFAVFPQKLVEPCIMAGTSERGACPECGKCWVRVVEKSTSFESGSGKSENAPSGKYAETAQTESGDYDIRMGPVNHIKTIGWQPQCECDKDPVPCLVLDPFMGSGTVALVALRANRRYIGIELNKDYIDMANQRLAPLRGQRRLI